MNSVNKLNGWSNILGRRRGKWEMWKIWREKGKRKQRGVEVEKKITIG